MKVQLYQIHEMSVPLEEISFAKAYSQSYFFILTKVL